MPRQSKPTTIRNECIDFSPILRTCGLTGLTCDYGTTMGCDIYSEIPRKPRQPQKPPAPEKPKRDFVKEIEGELDKMGVEYIVGPAFHEPMVIKHNEPKAPDWF